MSRLIESFESVEKILSMIDKKDWVRASAGYSTKQVESMFRKITDSRKRIGRAAAFYIYNRYIITGGWDYDYIKYFDDPSVADEIDKYFGEDKDILNSYEKLKTLNLPENLDQLIDKRYAKAVDEDEERKRRLATEGARKLEQKEEMERLKQIYFSSSNYVFKVTSKWNSAGGRLGNYTPTALTPAGRNMNESAIIKRLEKYEASGNYFCVVGYNGGVDYEFGSYHGRKTFTKDLVKAFRDWFSYDSDAYLEVYSMKKKKRKS